MSRTHHHGKRKIREWPFWRQPWNKEWWAARPWRYHSPSTHHNWWFKRALSKAERREGKMSEDIGFVTILALLNGFNLLILLIVLLA